MIIDQLTVYHIIQLKGSNLPFTGLLQFIRYYVRFRQEGHDLDDLPQVGIWLQYNTLFFMNPAPPIMYSHIFLQSGHLYNTLSVFDFLRFSLGTFFDPLTPSMTLASTDPSSCILQFDVFPPQCSNDCFQFAYRQFVQRPVSGNSSFYLQSFLYAQQRLGRCIPAYQIVDSLFFRTGLHPNLNRIWIRPCRPLARSLEGLDTRFHLWKRSPKPPVGFHLRPR